MTSLLSLFGVTHWTGGRDLEFFLRWRCVVAGFTGFVCWALVGSRYALSPLVFLRLSLTLDIGFRKGGQSGCD